MDAARTAFRLVGNNGKVTIVYRRTMREMPADQGEIKAVLEEGMDIMELVAPEKVIEKDGQVVGLICSKMELSGTDKSGRPQPVKIAGSEFELLCDTIIPAVGQRTDIDFASSEILSSEVGVYQTKAKNVFMGGDALRGASTAINAIGDGRKTAEQIMLQLGVGLMGSSESDKKHLTVRELMLKRAKRIPSESVEELALNDRKNFKLVSQTMSEKSVVAEASRCLYCDEICNICTTVCPNFANHAYEVKPVSYNLPKVVVKAGKTTIEKEGLFEITQPHQILNIANFCNECGNCNTFCPTQSAPYKEKPKVYLTQESYDLAPSGYFFDNNTLFYKEKDIALALTESGDQYLFESGMLTASIAKTDFSVSEVKVKVTVDAEYSLHQAAVMSVIMNGVKDLAK
jgi:putative selenate reductase